VFTRVSEHSWQFICQTRDIRIIPNPPVISHLFDHILNHNPELLSFTGAPQLAKTKINTNVKK
ncbi:MAG TPA: hypothetical protein P5312_09540, partial [Bacteroidales bacterium]|nr:hypothetical protein [Bacteroidales bacterium]HOL98575.1 hypothetical protein [Bacteroidales bacterium]HOM36901.1 hypothetical protein [Bacteroidales bacterium]HPD24429.1 hypothetical protein [Bacteroidales bacterium]HRT00271.1 hypothetical protein [Bacteroidales bacterium]